jgi:hypothetical protein
LPEIDKYRIEINKSLCTSIFLSQLHAEGPRYQALRVEALSVGNDGLPDSPREIKVGRDERPEEIIRRCACADGTRHADPG